jgi:hypothetical protein
MRHNASLLAAAMRHLLLLLAIASTLVPSTANAMSAAQQRQMRKQMLELEPDARAEERCDARANGAVQRDHRDFKPEKTIAYAFADVLVGEQMVEAPGAAIRSKGDWYHLSYRCRTSADGLDIESFEYELGSAIPKAEWSDRGLYP